MERLVRGHPCNIMVTYVNERFPNAGNRPQRHLTREEMTAFFEMADRMVHVQNPDRVIKHVDGDYEPPDTTLPDNHCYTCWYNGHGVDLGALIRGDWLPVSEGWYCGCGEFGTEGLDPVPLMRKYYPKEWLPQSDEEEKTWSPRSIVAAQTGQFHYFFSETPVTENFATEKARPEYQDQLDVYNPMLKEVCEKNGAHYIEIAEALKGEDNLLRLEYSNDKVCHLNEDGIAVWIQCMKDYAQEQYDLGLWDPFADAEVPETTEAE